LPGSVRNTSASLSGLTETIIEQSTAITATTGTGSSGTTYVESIPWTAPAAGTGSVVIYGVINAVNGNGSNSGDHYQDATHITITEANVAVAASIAITSGANPTCSGTSITFTATATNGGNSPTYQWQVDGSNVGTGGSTYTTSSLTNGQAVNCIITSSASGVSGNPAISNTITMTVNTPVIPTITAQGNVLTSSSATSYQWYLNGTAVGVTTQSYTISQAGAYTVKIYDSNGCSATSAAYNTATGISNISLSSMLSVYPNPTTDGWQLNAAAGLIGSELQVFNYDGRLVYSTQIEQESTPVQVNGPSGIYILRINTGTESASYKLVKL
jgi:hypothetical protein